MLGRVTEFQSFNQYFQTKLAKMRELNKRKLECEHVQQDHWDWVKAEDAAKRYFVTIGRL